MKLPVIVIWCFELVFIIYWDYVVIRKPNGPSKCKLVDNTIKEKRSCKRIDILDLFLDEHTRASNEAYFLSVSRCGGDLPFDLRSFKHSEPTPMTENDCCGRLMRYVSND